MLHEPPRGLPIVVPFGPRLGQLLQIQNARNALIVNRPGDRLGEQRGDAQLTYLGGERPGVRDRIGHEQIFQSGSVVEALGGVVRRRAEHAVGRPGVDARRSRFLEDVNVPLEGRPRVDDIVDNDALPPLDVAHEDGLVLLLLAGGATLGDEGHLYVLPGQFLQYLPELGGPGHLPLVGRYHGHLGIIILRLIVIVIVIIVIIVIIVVVAVVVLRGLRLGEGLGAQILMKISRGDGSRQQMLHGSRRTEESPQRIVVQIHAHDPIDSHLLEHPRDVGGGDGLSRPPPILTGISVVGYDGRDALGRRPTEARYGQ
mmetsp:Transcript_37420/g.112178  ORF Transcript_37420/g.112178 Transcript_37420/m.112178 type:complete len:314 (-) Transcript_37420:634-1575(-)